MYAWVFVVVVQPPCHVVTPHTAACQASLSFIISLTLLKFMAIELVMHPTILSCVTSFSSCFQTFLALGSFLMSQLITTGGQSIGASASASVLPMNIQGWFPLRLTALILLSKGLSLFSRTTVQKHQFFGTQPSLGPILTSVHDYWKNHRVDYMDLCWQSDIFAFLPRDLTRVSPIAWPALSTINSLPWKKHFKDTTVLWRRPIQVISEHWSLIQFKTSPFLSSEASMGREIILTSFFTASPQCF